MGWTSALERQYWRDELRLFRRWGLWPVLVLAVLTGVPAMLGYPQSAIGWAIVLIAFVLVRRVLAGRDLSARDASRWRKKVEASLQAQWPALVVGTGLAVRGVNGQPVYVGLGQPRWDGWTCILPLAVPTGVRREEVVAQTDVMAGAFAARSVTVVGQRAPHLALRIDYIDALELPFSLPFGEVWDGRTVEMGRTSLGEPWRLRLGPHTLVAGSSGSGKASLVWGLLLGLAQPIREGVVEVWGVDRKGGMELALGRPLLTRFADDASHSVALLEEAVAAMQKRARDLAGKTRQHVPTSGSPTVVILIDELAALTAYETDRDLLRRANAAIATLASQGRAVGFVVFACLQDPRKETLPARGLFTQTVGLRLRDGVETAMVLGDGAVAAGALCHTISPDSPGVAYVLPDDGRAPERVRAGFVSDDMIRDAAARFTAPRHIPVVVPEAHTASERPARAPRQSRRTVRKESAS